MTDEAGIRPGSARARSRDAAGGGVRPGRWSGHLLLLAAFSTLASCAGDAGDDGAAVRSRMGDTLLVHNRYPVHADTAELIPVQTWGTLDGPIETTFGSLREIAVGARGELLVAENGQGIRRFGPEGDFLGYLARDGEGPGEVGAVYGLAGDDQGTVASVDLGNNRLTVFGPTGRVVTRLRPAGLPRYDEDALAFHHDGSLWIGFNPQYDASGRMDFPRPAFARVTTEGLADTIWVPDRVLERCPLLTEIGHRSGFWEDNREPFFPKAQWALGPDGSFAYGCPADYEFDILRPDGAVLRISRDWTPLEVSDEERGFWGGRTPVPTPPRQRPAYARILLTGDGRAWVWPNQPSGTRPLGEALVRQTGLTETWGIAETGAFDVFDREGRWIGSVRVPDELAYSGYPTTPGLRIRGDTIWAIATGELDEQYVRRYRVRWPE